MNIIKIIKKININLIFILIYLSGVFSYCSLLLFIPFTTIHFIFPQYINIIYLFKNMYMSSFSIIIDFFLDTKIYVNSLELFEDITNYPNQQNLVILNHVAEHDFFIISYIYNNIKNFYSTKSFGLAKKNVGYKLMGYGFISLLSGDKYLDRNINLDYDKLNIKNNSNLLFLFPEGTCFSKDKKINSDNYCKKNNLPILKYHLYPRVTGIRTIFDSNPNFNYIHDITIIYDTINKKDYGIEYSIYNYIFNGNFPKKVFLQITKYKVEKKMNYSKLLEKIYFNKDNFIDKFEINNNKFVPIKYNYFNGLISLYIVCNISIISLYIWYTISTVKYIYIIESILYYFYFYFYC